MNVGGLTTIRGTGTGSKDAGRNDIRIKELGIVCHTLVLSVGLNICLDYPRLINQKGVASQLLCIGQVVSNSNLEPRLHKACPASVPSWLKPT